jgi:hypothetical protein
LLIKQKLTSGEYLELIEARVSFDVHSFGHALKMRFRYYTRLENKRFLFNNNFERLKNILERLKNILERLKNILERLKKTFSFKNIFLSNHPICFRI